MLNFDPHWRFESPGSVSSEFFHDCHTVIGRLSRGRQDVLEHFKDYFASVAGSTSSRSSNASWADSDLQDLMSRASDNAPLFIEAIYDGWENLKSLGTDFLPINLIHLNKLLDKNKLKFRIEPPNLVSISDNHSQIELPSIPLSFDEQAKNAIQESQTRARRLLNDRDLRPAIQEILWLLESVSTIFRGVTVAPGANVTADYFNKIIGELRRHLQGTHFVEISKWIMAFHGYLSAPSGGGIRHGMDLRDGQVVSEGEARLYLNLIISYTSFLISEYDRLESVSRATPQY